MPRFGILVLVWTALIVMAGFSVRGLIVDAALVASPSSGSPVAKVSPCATTPSASPSAQPNASSESGELASVADTVTIELTDHGFVPTRVQSTSGDALTITLTNTGSREHSFRIDHFQIAASVDPGETQTIVIDQPDLGEFPYVSDAPCDQGMRGLLVFYI